MTTTTTPLDLFIGTYTRREPHVAGRAEGIYRYRFDPVTGDLTRVGTTTGIENPSFLAFNRDGSRLYAAGEVGDFEGGATGSLSAYAVDDAAVDHGGLTLLNRVASGGMAPCYVTVHGHGHLLLVSNYSSGTVAAFPIDESGALSPATSLVQHTGAGPNPARQQGPHAHSINVSPDGRFAIAADLGTDELIVYQLAAGSGALTHHQTVAIHPGAGPRHLDFHPNGRLAFVINELDSTLTTLTYDAADGTVEVGATYSTLPAGFDGDNTCADIHVHPNGRYLYGSNRGHDSIALFRVDATSGSLTPAGHTATDGRTPRNFALTPDGRYLLAANQDTGTVTVFSLDNEGASLRRMSQIDVPSPVCLCFRPTP